MRAPKYCISNPELLYYYYTEGVYLNDLSVNNFFTITIYLKLVYDNYSLAKNRTAF